MCSRQADQRGTRSEDPDLDGANCDFHHGRTGRLAAITQWHMLVLKKLEPFLLWPKDAPQDVKSASPWVRVKIDRQGHVLSATVIKSSGYDFFDKAARQVFKRAATLPPPPSDLPGEPFSFNMVVNFRNSLPASDR